MDFTHFVRIERTDEDGKTRHYVVHAMDPKLSLELTPDNDAPDKIGQGVIKRVCVPNSWAGDYTRYFKLLSAAQAFFRNSREAEAGGRPDRSAGMYPER